MPLAPLPIDDILPELVRALPTRSAAVVHAPPGAGKTTRVATALLDAGLAGAGEIVMLEPRRIAARSAARRIASERGERVGETIGYQVRFDSAVSRETRIRIVTDGILLRRLQDDPYLDDVAIVIFDEFHERSLECDIALGMVRRIQQTIRPELKLVVMSATLAADPVSAYLDHCPIVRSEGRTFPVETRYLRRADRRPLPEQIADAVRDALPDSDGDLLVFLPGVGEIFRCRDELHSLANKHNCDLLPLYGDLPMEEQDRVLAPSPRRKIVLATNVAETSITIDGITTVVDSGLARVLRFDHGVGLDRLALAPISKASADQRAGRAGRTQPGICLRLWEEAQQRVRPEFDEPDIRRVDLSGTVLQLLAWGERDLAAFPWYEAPSSDALEHARNLLRRLGALDDDGVTVLGFQMLRLPVPPRLARLLVEGQRYGYPDETARVAALLSERSPFQRHDRQPSKGPRTTTRHASRSDVLDLLQTFDEAERSGRTDTPLGTLNRGAAANINRIARQLGQLVETHLDEAPEPRLPVDEALGRALLAAYPDRLARKRDTSGPRALMVGGRGVQLGPLSAVINEPLFLCVDVDDRQTNALVRLASGVDRDWLSGPSLRTADEMFLHPSQKSVVARRRTYWDDLLLDESNLPAPEPLAAADVLFAEARRQFAAVFPSDNKEFNDFIVRVRCLHQWMPELELPTVTQEGLEAILHDLCRQCRSFHDLRQADWLAAIQAHWSYAQRQLVERETPQKIQVPSGNQIRLTYEEGRPPVLAVRIQELFGLHETPRIAGGRVKVLLHLLAPNFRPQQVTDDLASFWSSTYAEVRKDLRRRYPKHAWPEDPWTAVAVRKK